MSAFCCAQREACVSDHDGDYGSAGHPGSCCNCSTTLCLCGHAMSTHALGNGRCVVCGCVVTPPGEGA